MPRQIDHPATVAAPAEFAAQRLKGKRGAVFGRRQVAHKQPALRCWFLAAAPAAEHQSAERCALRCAFWRLRTPVRTARHTQRKSSLMSSQGPMVAMYSSS